MEARKAASVGSVLAARGLLDAMEGGIRDCSDVDRKSSRVTRGWGGRGICLIWSVLERDVIAVVTMVAHYPTEEVKDSRWLGR